MVTYEPPMLLLSGVGRRWRGEGRQRDGGGLEFLAPRKMLLLTLTSAAKVLEIPGFGPKKVDFLNFGAKFFTRF